MMNDAQTEPSDLAVPDAIEIDGQEFKDGDVRRMILEQIQKTDQALREIAKLLFAVYQRSLFTRWGFKNFQEYVEADLGFKYRKANYLVNIWSWYTENVHREDIMDAIWNEVGWSKAKELVGVINDENADHWLARARELNAVQLAEEARKYLKLQAGDGDGDSSSGGGDEFKTMSFKLTTDQKANVEEAVELASKMSGSEKKGHNVDLISTNFIANNADSLARDALDFLSTIEKQYGISLLAVRLSDKTVIHGREVFEAIREDIRKEITEAKPTTEEAPGEAGSDEN